MFKKILFLIILALYNHILFSQVNFSSRDLYSSHNDHVIDSSIRLNPFFLKPNFEFRNNTNTITYSKSDYSDFLQKSNLFLKTLRFDSSRQENQINTGRLIAVSAGLTGLFIGFHFYQMNAWWKNDRGPFHVLDDPDYAAKIDKVGHFYGGMLSADIGRGLAYWAGFSQKSSAWIGFGIGSLWELYIEIEDGFGKNWGFSPSDATMDIIGSAYSLGQGLWEPLNAFNFKFSYVPSPQLNVMKNGNKKIMIDDYEGQTYWLTFNIYDLMPFELKKNYPGYLQWLQLAVGYGLKNYDGNEEFAGNHVTDKELYISLDYSLQKLLNIDTKFFRSLKESETIRTILNLLDHFHLPAPAIRITFPGTRTGGPVRAIVYGLYFSN